MKKQKKQTRTVISENRKARHDYTVRSTLETGIVLTGPEVKGCCEHKLSLQNSYAEIAKGQLVLKDAVISQYENATHIRYAEKRDRVLLAHKKEIRRLLSQVKEKGMTLVPLSVYFNETNLIKVELGVCQGKHSYDKREALKKKDAEREIRRAK